MQCRDAEFYLRLRRQANDELGSDVTADLDRHLAGCSECSLASRSIQSFDCAVASAMKAVAIPAGLRDKLLTQALAHRGTVLRRKVYQLAALAASLFLVMGLVFGFFSASRPRLDVGAMAWDQSEQFQNPDVAIRNWLSAEHLPTDLPLPFNTALFVAHGYERVQGKEVPVIVFGNPPGSTGNEFAKLYFFRTNGEFRIDPEKLHDFEASNTSAKVLRDQPHAPGVVFVIIHTGRDLTPFLRSEPRAVGLARPVSSWLARSTRV
jgi:hypothetical protein